MRVSVALALLWCASLSTSCSSSVKDFMQIYRAMYRNIACVQCQPFDVATALNFNCDAYAELFDDATCGLSIPLYSLSAKHCVVTTLTCLSVEVGDGAAWGISAGSIDEAADEEIVLISEQRTISVDLQLYCNNSSTWSMDHHADAFAPPSTAFTRPRKPGAGAASLPDFFAAGDFTLHCISGRMTADEADYCESASGRRDPRCRQNRGYYRRRSKVGSRRNKKIFNILDEDAAVADNETLLAT